VRYSLFWWPARPAFLWNAKGTSKGSLDSLSYGCFHGGNELLGEGFDLSGDVRVGVGHDFSWMFLSRPSYGRAGKVTGLSHRREHRAGAARVHVAHGTWDLANLYLGSMGAALLGPDAP
jgi:hypothetical protein